MTSKGAGRRPGGVGLGGILERASQRSASRRSAVSKSAVGEPAGQTPRQARWNSSLTWGTRREKWAVWTMLGNEREESGNGEADDWVWGGADCAGSVGILRDGRCAPDGADSGVLRAGAGGVRGTGEDGECEAANAVDACRGDGGAAGVSGIGIAGGGGV